MCVDYGCFSYTIYDSHGDGICCRGKNKGSYILVNENTNEMLASGGSFGSSETTPFCLIPEEAVCEKPAGISASNISNSDATLSWTAASEALSYRVGIREQNGNWAYSTTSITSVNYTNLTTCTDYEFQVKSLCDEDSSDFSAIYEFQTTGCPEPCDYPTGISASNISNSTATLSWTAASGALSYRVGIREQNGNWAYFTTSSNSVNYTNLTTCTDYEFEVKSICDNDSSDFSNTYGFKTTGCISSCDVPAGLYTSHINKKRARLNWNAVSDAQSYTVQYWVQGSSNVTTTSTTNTNLMLNGLNEQSTYEWHVRTNCSSSSSDYSTTSSFVAGDPNSASSLQFDELTSIENVSNSEPVFNLFPNPNTGFFTVYYSDGNQRNYQITIMDLTGRVIFENKKTGNELNLEIDLSGYAKGTYLLVLSENNMVLKNAKIVLTE